MRKVPFSKFVEVNPGRRAPPQGVGPNTEVSFIPMGDVSESGEWSGRQLRRLRDVSAGYTPFFEEDVLFAKITPCMENGKGAHAVGLAHGVGFGTTEFHVLRAREGADSRFIFHWTMTPTLRLRAESFMTGSAGQRRVQAKFFEYFKVSDIPFDEQRQIAEVLDTVDEALRKTDQVIAKLERIKHGLLHDLLTRGIDDNGELRDPVRRPEQFKDSPLGRIPRCWDVLRVERLLAAVDPAMRSGPFGSALLKSELVEAGVPLLGIDNVHVERFDRTFTRFVKPAKALELSRYSVRPDDVMITIMGTVGRCCVVPKDIGHALSTKHVWTLTLDQTRYSPFLACIQFNHTPWVLRHFGQDEQGGIMSAIRSQTLRTAILPVPPAREMGAIVDILQAHRSRVETEETVVAKLRLTRQGLMEDLLTGRVRVTKLVENQSE